MNVEGLLQRPASGALSARLGIVFKSSGLAVSWGWQMGLSSVHRLNQAPQADWCTCVVFLVSLSAVD